LPVCSKLQSRIPSTANKVHLRFEGRRRVATGPAKGLTAIFRKLAGVVGMAIPGWSDLAHTPRVGRFGWAGLLVTNLGVR